MSPIPSSFSFLDSPSLKFVHAVIASPVKYQPPAVGLLPFVNRGSRISHFPKALRRASLRFPEDRSSYTFSLSLKLHTLKILWWRLDMGRGVCVCVWQEVQWGDPVGVGVFQERCDGSLNTSSNGKKSQVGGFASYSSIGWLWGDEAHRRHRGGLLSMFSTWANEQMVVTFTGKGIRGEAGWVMKDKTSLEPLSFEMYAGQANTTVVRQMVLWVCSSGKATQWSYR